MVKDFIVFVLDNWQAAATMLAFWLAGYAYASIRYDAHLKKWKDKYYNMCWTAHDLSQKLRDREDSQRTVPRGERK